MIYKRNLSSNDYILLYLKEFINEVSLCKKIINLKNKLENADNILYHLDRWENISGEHLHMMNNYNNNNFSLIFNEEDFIVVKDYRSTFYNLTGISYQIVSLVQELIKKRRGFIENDNDLIGKNLFIIEDKLYSILGKEIMIKMKIN
tara:strand:- start:87 stop:527 length:441 start_codon:yes stop_codon:yes gene_type:complete